MAQVEIIKRGNIKTNLYVNGDLLTDFKEDISEINLAPGSYSFGVSKEKSLKAEKIKIKSNKKYVVDITYDYRYFVTGMIITASFAIYGFMNAVADLENVNFKILFLPLAFLVFMLTFKFTQIVVVSEK